MGTQVESSISAGSQHQTGSQRGRGSTVTGGVSGSLGFTSVDRGTTSESARATLDVINYDVRSAINTAENAVKGSHAPESAFSHSLAEVMLGQGGIRDRYLQQAGSARGTFDLTSPLTSVEQSSVLRSGRLSTDLAHGPFDGSAGSPKENSD